MTVSFPEPVANITLRDKTTGDLYVAVTKYHGWARQRGYHGTEPELIRQMERVGWHRTRETFTNPADQSEKRIIDFFRIPADWPTEPQSGVPTAESQSKRARTRETDRSHSPVD
jgi:hypothetical protein